LAKGEKKFVADWLKEWMKKNKKHRTINEGNTLVCPQALEMLDIRIAKRYRYCPLCGAELGNSLQDENYNLIWTH